MNARFWLLGALALSASAVAACGSSPSATPPPAIAPKAPAAAAAPVAPDPGDPLEPALNLSFERGTDGWHTGGDGYVVEARADAAHAGASGLHLGFVSSTGKHSFGVATTQLPIEKARDHVLHLSGWLRTRDVDGYAGLWLRVDDADGPVSLENMHDTGPRGTTDWQRYQFDVVVPSDAHAVYFGVLLVGTGEAWADDLRFGFEAQKAPHPVRVQGAVRGPDGMPVSGAIVAAVGKTDAEPAIMATTDASGHFDLTITSGDYALTATGESGAAAYAMVRTIDSDASIDLALERGGFTVSGKVKCSAVLPPDARVLLTRSSEVYGDVFVALVDAQGAFHARLPEAQGYWASFSSSSKRATSTGLRLAGKGDQSMVLDVDILQPPTAAVVEWVGKAAARLRTPEAGNGFDDLAPVARMVAGARIIALGEATHGTREFFQLKHRFLEYLVEKQGFTLFAIEANLSEARRVNEYVLEGKGSAREALAGMYFWTWNTEEVLAMIEWMRAYDAEPKHKKKVQFLGFDMQATNVAWPSVKAYLARVDATQAAALPASLDIFDHDGESARWKALPAEQRKTMLETLDALVARLDASEKVYARKSSAKEWRAAREDARLVAQTARMYDAEAGFDARDVAMAENIGWILDHEAKGAKMVVWAHNGHIAHSWTDASITNMGAHLTHKYGKEYVPFGFVFGEGSFQAMGMGSAERGLRERTLGPASDVDVSKAFADASCSICVLDLRAAPPGPVAEWFAAPHLQRETGAVFSTEANMTGPVRLSKRFDAVIFVRTTTRARPVKPEP